MEASRRRVDEAQFASGEDRTHSREEGPPALSPGGQGDDVGGGGIAGTHSIRTIRLEEFPDRREWDSLVARSREDSFFLRSSFLIPVWETVEKRAPIYFSQARLADGELVAAGLFVPGRRGSLTLLASEPGDYLDILTDRRLTDDQSATLKREMIADVLGESGRHVLYLPHVVDSHGTTKTVLGSSGGLHGTSIRTMPAPAMRLNATDSRINRSSFRRVENRLARQGKVEFHQWTTPDEVVARLPAFFDQHQRRWKGTPCERFFADVVHRELFVRLAESVGQTPWLRYSELRLNGALAASHFGFRYGARFLWYKPAYERDLSKLSPGIVLIHRLIEQALAEGASELDFTIGGEAFKSRYADVERSVSDLYVTNQWWRAAILRTDRRARRLARNVLNAVCGEVSSGQC